MNKFAINAEHLNNPKIHGIVCAINNPNRNTTKIVRFHNSLFLPGTRPGGRVISLTRYKGKDNFYISKHFSLNFTKKFCFVLNRRIPSYRSGRQCLFKRGVGWPVLAQFEPMFEFGPLDHNPANPVRVPGNIRVNLCFHSSLSVVQPKYRTRIGFVCTRRFPTLPADKSNGNSLSGRSVCSSNPTFCNGRIVLLSYQNNFGVGSNNDAFSASSSFSNRRDSSKISGLRNVKNQRCVCRTCATNRTYSAACSGVIFSKFSICGHFVPSWYNLSIFLFACLYGLLFGLCGDVGFSGPSTLGFRV